MHLPACIALKSCCMWTQGKTIRSRMQRNVRSLLHNGRLCVRAVIRWWSSADGRPKMLFILWLWLLLFPSSPFSFSPPPPLREAVQKKKSSPSCAGRGDEEDQVSVDWKDSEPLCVSASGATHTPNVCLCVCVCASAFPWDALLWFSTKSWMESGGHTY